MAGAAEERRGHREDEAEHEGDEDEDLRDADLDLELVGVRCRAAERHEPLDARASSAHADDASGRAAPTRIRRRSGLGDGQPGDREDRPSSSGAARLADRGSGSSAPRASSARRRRRGPARPRRRSTRRRRGSPRVRSRRSTASRRRPPTRAESTEQSATAAGGEVRHADADARHRRGGRRAGRSPAPGRGRRSRRRSQTRSTSLRRCELRNTVVPASRARRMIARTSARPTGSSADVGSSRTTSAGAPEQRDAQPEPLLHALREAADADRPARSSEPDLVEDRVELQRWPVVGRARPSRAWSSSTSRARSHGW